MSYQTKILRKAASAFDESYYKTGNYRDYLMRKFALLAQEVIAPVDVKINEPIFDFGCGCGGLLNALHELGFRNLQGVDKSKWAISACRKMYPHLRVQVGETIIGDGTFAYPSLTLVLDVLEHVPEHMIDSFLKFMSHTRYLSVRIPVCAKEGEPFVLPVSNNDPTHICCHTKLWWEDKLNAADLILHHVYDGKAIYDSPGVMSAIFKRIL